MHDGINLSYIGLSQLEVRVLKSIFTLAPQLKNNYTLVGPDMLRQADLVLVNTDDPKSIRLWTLLKQENSLVSSILLTDSDDLNTQERTIQRPIRVQKLISALEDIVEQTSVEFAQGTTSNVFSVMVVDDSFPVRKYMEHKLRELIEQPFEIHFSASGEEAIAKTARKHYDLIFLDVMMEGLDGYKTCKNIKASCGSYVVMLTSKKSPFDKVRGTMSGCDAYVTKPPSDERLLEVVGKCLSMSGAPSADVARASAQ